MLDYENIWNNFLSLSILKPNQFFEFGYSAEMCRDLLRVLLSQSPTGLLPPRSSVNQQRAALGRHPQPLILSTPQYTPTLAPHHPWQCTIGTTWRHLLCTGQERYAYPVPNCFSSAEKRQKIFLCFYIPILMRKDQWEIAVSQEFVLMSWSRLNSRTQRPEAWEIQCRLLLKKYLKSLWRLQQSRRAYGKSKRYQRCDLIDTLQPTIFESWEKGEVIRVYQDDY